MDASLIPLITCTAILTVLLVFTPTRLNIKVFQAFVVLSALTIWWHGSWVALFRAGSESAATRIAVFGHMGILFLPVAYRNLYKGILGITRREPLLYVIYGLLLVALLSTNWIVDGVHRYSWGYYPKAGILHPVYLGLVTWVVLASLADSLQVLRVERDPERRRAIITGILGCVVFSLGAVDFLLNYRLVSFYPPGFVASILFILINAVGIMQFDLYRRDLVLRSLNQEKQFLYDEVDEREKDINNLKATLIHQEKLASLGMLASGVAHQLGNTLNIISTSNVAIGRMNGRKTIDNEKLGRCSETIAEGLELSQDIIDSINYIGKENDDFARNNLRKIVQSGIVLTKGKSLENVTILNNVDEDLDVWCSKSSLSQVFMNLISNAIDAIPGPDGRVAIQVIERSQQRVVISVKDNGCGIPEAVRPMVFEPFVTSKNAREGTGLGLYLVKEELNKHHAWINYETGVAGTIFYITLPGGNHATKSTHSG